ncbi:hypothetical protein FIBSPDRAFT_884180 [Athelia psychrophila]|uniref:Uncharacterized protein n=1 Tax=Athelia psychrophila TaxID=1759441 RepID=A0A166T6N7_9AGAM|nr:hypothetical protein FIBSPDRAFT_884180 [Fibularhizoctonia sp. CBS 109695]
MCLELSSLGVIVAFSASVFGDGLSKFPKSLTAITQLSAVLYIVTHPDEILASQVHESGPANHWLVRHHAADFRYPSDILTQIARTEPIMQQLLWLSTSTGFLLW